MARTFSRLSESSISQTVASALDGNSLQNEILLSLPGRERATLFPQLEFVEMQNRDLLNQLGAPIEYCYFVNTGLASILNVLSDGKTVEVGLAGKEGFVGLPLVVGLSTSSTRVIVQVSGNAWRATAAGLARVLRKCPHLERKLNLYSQEFGLQAAQVAACNRLHGVSQRMARWLLMSQDRLGGERVPLTQEFLAHMLGTRRASVTVAAAILQKTGSIKYRRGTVEVLSRGKLEAAACECYTAMTRQLQNWRNEQP